VDLLEVLKPENCVAARTSYGGPAFSENAKQLAMGDKILQEQKKVIAALFRQI
jgi:argininosuccinate lyase